METDKLELLEKFVCDNKELRNLEKMFEKFNIFDCLKLSRQEIRHSNFLAWLMDPTETHGLNDDFIKEFLKEILLKSKNEIKKINGVEYNIPSVFDIDCWDMTNAEVEREKEHIDILVIDETNKFILVIENKIDACQSPDQLGDYKKVVDNKYSNMDYKKLFLYLKPKDNEEIPSPYIYASYDSVISSINTILKNKTDKISTEIKMAISHYKDILERDIMNEDQIKIICKKIYKQHRRAIELINKQIDSYDKETHVKLSEIIKSIIKNNNDLILEDSNEEWIRFIPKAGDFESLKFAKDDWTKSDRMLMFEIHNAKKYIQMDIIIRQVNNEKNEKKREKLLNIAREKCNFKYKKGVYTHISRKFLVSQEEYDITTEKTDEEIKSILEKAIKNSNYIENFNSIAEQFDEKVSCQD